MSKKSKKKKKQGKEKRVITLGASSYENENGVEVEGKPEVNGVAQGSKLSTGMDYLDEFGDISGYEVSSFLSDIWKMVVM